MILLLFNSNRNTMSKYSEDDFMQKPLQKTKFMKNFVEHKPKRLQKKEGDEDLSESHSKLDNKFSILQKKFIKKVDIVHEDDSKKVKADLKKPLIVIDREVQGICEILKYMLGQHHNSSDVSYFDPQKSCENWQFDQIIKQVSDTNLGDFIIKCPNPDNLSEQLKEIYEQDKEQEQKKPFKLTTSQALQFYYDLFDIQQSSKFESQKQHVAFIIAFYFLKFENTLEAKDQICATYIKIYNYFKIVQTKLLSQYLVIRQDQNFYQKHQKLIWESFQNQMEAIQCLVPQKSLASTDEESWNKLKRTIYWNLNTHINREFQSYKEIEHDSKQASQSMFQILMGKVKSISQILLTFPELTEKLLLHIKETNDGDHPQERNLFGGQYLKKTIKGEKIIWVNSKNRPNDVTTLLRFSLIYKLVIKSKLFLRSFLSKDEESIMLVIKTSEEILQNYAQKYKINMEVDLGATDLFSFQPVDRYMRPLRLHQYIRDIEFRQKYNIRGPDKMSAEDQDGLKSIQSEAITIYQKASVMNEDELRTKIIMDQFEADRAYDWISRQLNIDFIRQKALVNEYNSKNPGRHTWELYFVYNKMIIQFTKRTQNLFKVDKKAKDYFQQLQGNIGMILRLMFLKALQTCNDLFYNFRQTRSIIPRALSNIWTSKYKLKNIWDYIGVQIPSGFCTYRRTKSNQKMWRKFQINQLKDRSKFFASERLVITNKVIYDNINLSKSLQKKLIIDYYPLHDPYVMKNIEIAPYIGNIKKKKKDQRKQSDGLDGSIINKMYSQYECELTKGDFTKMSLQQKLSFKLGEFKQFSADSVRYYCGQKIAFFFSFMKFLAVKAFPLLLIAMLIQILLWAEQTDILAKGSSTLTEFNNVLIFIFTFVNVFWTTNLVETWKAQERRIAQSYGVSELTQFQEKRVRFEGAFKRNFETDELNYEYVPKWKTILKTFYTVILNVLYVILVVIVILLLFLMKTYLLQKGYDQNIVNSVPSMLIAIASQVFSQIYTIILKKITIFQNHKTVSDYEGSLISKASLITFIINFYSIFIFAYFSDFLASSYICQIKTTETNKKINNCGYFVSSQLLSIVMVDMAMTVVGAILPFVMFQLNLWLQGRKKKKSTTFNASMFESIDQFYEEQDKMQTYMYNEELDNSWQGYMTIINVFTATALFAPALPFAYVMMFITGIIRLHTSKYEVIYFKRRILPIKQNSINWWLIIIEAISYISIVTNLAYMIYTRQLFQDNRGKYFFLFIILFFALKYYLISQYNSEDNQMFKRNEIKTMDLLLGRRQDKYDCIPEEVNTDIQNVIYDETLLGRKFHSIKQPNIRSKQKKA